MKQYVDISISWVLGMLLIASAIPHINNPYYFLGSVYSYSFMPRWAGQVVAAVLPVLLLLVAMCLLCRVLTREAHYLTMLLLASFTCLQAFAWMRGLAISCGCFGPAYDTAIGIQSITIAGGALVLALFRECFLRLSVHGEQNVLSRSRIEAT